MSRHLAVLLVLASTWLGGCGGDDSVNPTNPEAGPTKSGDAAADHEAKADSASDAAKSTGDGGSEGATGHDASSDATEHDASSEGGGGDGSSVDSAAAD